jgi:hypothetical protein
MPVCPETPPCEAARYGACFSAYALYMAWLSGLPPMIALVEHGNALGIAWAVFGGLGIAGLVAGVGAALTHDDPFRPRSFLWSVGVIALGSYALLHGWVLTDSAFDYHLTTALWLGWMASNLVNVLLNLRGFFLPRRPRFVDGVARPVPRRAPLLRRRRVSTEWIEEIEIRGIDAGDFPLPGDVHLPSGVLPDLIAPGGPVPQIRYVKHGDTFVPVPVPDAVPVQRR